MSISLYPTRAAAGEWAARAPTCTGATDRLPPESPSERFLLVAQMQRDDAVAQLDGILSQPRLEPIMVGPYRPVRLEWA
ncbi:MAG: hypothetical protein V8Q84_10345 [Bilophila sp.]